MQTFSKIFFSAISALRVHSMLSGFGVPYFFLARRFSVPPLSPFQTFYMIFFHFSATRAFRVYSILSGFGVPNFFFGPSFLCSSSFFHFSNILAFGINLILSGFGMPHFLGAGDFSIPTLGQICAFLDNKFVSTLFNNFL